MAELIQAHFRKIDVLPLVKHVFTRNHHCKHLAASEDKRLSGLGPAEEREVELPLPASLVLHEFTLQTYSVQKYSCEIGV